VPNRETAIAVDNPRRRGAALRTAFPRLPLVLQLGATEMKVLGNNPPLGPGEAHVDLVEDLLLQRLDQQGVQLKRKYPLGAEQPTVLRIIY
jgi:hypothetical protein